MESQEVLSLKYQQTRFAYMDENEAHMHVKGLAMKICVVTGWQLPDTQEYMLVLIDQLNKKFNEDYSTLNPAEVEYAIRRYGIGVKDWGKSMNLSLIDGPVKEYMQLRAEVSKIESQQLPLPVSKTDEKREKVESAFSYAYRWYTNPPPLSIPRLQTDLPADWPTIWGSLVGMAKKGQIENSNFPIPSDLYSWLEKEGKADFTIEEKKEQMRVARTAYIAELKSKSYADFLTSDEVIIQSRLLNDGWYSDPQIRSLVVLRAKQLAVKQLAMSEAMNDI